VSLDLGYVFLVFAAGFYIGMVAELHFRIVFRVMFAGRFFRMAQSGIDKVHSFDKSDKV
jgi:hypothetical protein